MPSRLAGHPCGRKPCLHSDEVAAKSRSKRIENRLGSSHIGRRRLAGEISTKRREKLGRLGGVVLARPLSGESRRRAQLPKPRALTAGDFERPLEQGHDAGRIRGRKTSEKARLLAQHFGLVPPFAGLADRCHRLLEGIARSHTRPHAASASARWVRRCGNW